MLDHLIELRTANLVNPVESTRYLDCKDWELGYEAATGVLIARNRKTSQTRIIPGSNIVAMEPAGAIGTPKPADPALPAKPSKSRR